MCILDGLVSYLLYKSFTLMWVLNFKTPNERIELISRLESTLGIFRWEMSYRWNFRKSLEMMGRKGKKKLIDTHIVQSNLRPNIIQLF